MDVAFTHEQADFDAIASLLGVNLLDENIIPVLPRRYNRNVSSFINLYRADLPFYDQKNLPADPINSITLVDTQSLVTPKRMTARTKINVIDHHRLRANIPSTWSVAIHELGACTTFIVEAIREKNITLTVIQATLLLLGVYEDTGSLTYTRTTPRDVHAAAYLLEQGASLHIAGEYLYPPLSDEQRKLYNQLLANTETHHLHGKEIILARAFAEDMTDEVSSAAHKIRDLLEPDALILIISTTEGIRLVARSTSNQVDVSTIASHFGGGGHQRAAAALIRLDKLGLSEEREKAIQQIYDELIAILPRFVLPEITVGEIMSSQPSLLTPDQPASEAAVLMQRFGYEGFPVVKNEKVIGLLNRRSVDRALAHKLDMKIESLMEAGEITIHPDKTLEDLQTLMNTTGWGQIPVVDPVNEKVIGIVTRTDLISTLAREQTTYNRKRNLAEKLEKALPRVHIDLLKKITELATEQDLPLYIVGGFVRDLLLDRPSLDFDLVVEGNAITLAASIKHRYGGTIVSHKRFGTAKWRITDIIPKFNNADPHEQIASAPPESLDFISARTEFYDHPTALPVVERSSIKLDLHRRDFSINTLALRLDGEHYGDLYDYWGGLDDINKGFIRVLHSLSFVDDPTRLLRAVRFEQRFGFSIETRTLQLMHEAHSLIHQVSGDRIRHELDAIIDEKKVTHMLDRLHELGLLTAITPYLTWSKDIAEKINHIIQIEPDSGWNLPDKIGNANFRRALIYLIWFVHLPISRIKAIGKRLRLSRKLLGAILEVHTVKERLLKSHPVTPSEFVMQLDGVSTPTLYLLFNTLAPEKLQKGLLNFVTTWRYIKPFADGETLKEYDILPGPIYKDILIKLRHAWLDDDIHSLEEENVLLNQLIESHSIK